MVPCSRHITTIKTHMLPVVRELRNQTVRCYRYAYTINYIFTNS